MQNNYLKFNFIFLAVIIALFIVVPISNAATINAGDYEYSNDGGYIYEYNGKTKEKKILTSGHVVQISHNKDRLLYSNIVLEESGALAASSKAMGIYTYDLNTNKDVLLYPMKPDDDPVSIFNWSPNDKYIALFYGGSTETGFVIIDSISGAKIVSIGVHETEFAWLNSNEIIFSERQDNINQNKDSSGAPYGVTIMNVVNNQKRVLKEASNTASYYFQKLTADNKIVFSSLSFITITNNKGRLEYPITYWLMDNNGNVLEEVKDYKPQ